MHHKLHKTGLAVLLLAISGYLLCCKTKSEAAPVVNFSFSKSEIREGDTIYFYNNTTNGSVFEWTISPNGVKYNDRTIIYTFTNAGEYDITLFAKNGEGVSGSNSQTITVLPDSIYRLSNRRKKIWAIRSIIYNGAELQTQTCQLDDEFTVYKNAADTCTITHGQDTCPSGTYLFELPATSQWRYNQKSAAFEFALTAFGSPINLSFGIKHLTHDSFYGFDAVNNVSIKLGLKK